MDEEQRNTAIAILTKIVGAIIANEALLHDDPDPPAMFYDLGQSLGRSVERDLYPYHQDPIGRALRDGVTAIGQIIVPATSFDELVGLIDAVAGKTTDADSAIAVLDAAWDGLHTSDGHRWTV